jgi:hypothetical protein
MQNNPTKETTMNSMNSMKQLSREADARRAGHDGRPEYEIRADIEAALAAEFPAAAQAAAQAASEGRGKKAVVAAAAATVLDLEDPEVVEAVRELAAAGSWRAADRALARLGFAGEMISRPQARGLSLPCAAHACPGSWGTNWGLPNVRAAAQMILRRVPAQPTRGNGWEVRAA